jgi:hypothetical protein
VTAILPEQPAVLAAALPNLAAQHPDVQAAIGARLIRALGLSQPNPDYEASLATGLTETFEAYCARISKETRA